MKITLFGNEFNVKTRYVLIGGVIMVVGVAATAKYLADKVVIKGDDDDIFEYKNGKRFIKNKDVAAMLAKKDIELVKARRAAAAATGTYVNDSVQINDVILPGNYYQYR